jgi:hypothetical protein
MCNMMIRQVIAPYDGLAQHASARGSPPPPLPQCLPDSLGQQARQWLTGD